MAPQIASRVEFAEKLESHSSTPRYRKAELSSQEMAVRIFEIDAAAVVVPADSSPSQWLASLVFTDDRADDEI